MVLLIANHIKWLSLFNLLILLCILAGWQLPSWTMTIKPTSFNHIARTFHFELLSGLEIHFRQTLTLILHRFHVVHKFLKARLFPCFFTITSFDNTPTLILFVFHFLGENWKKARFCLQKQNWFASFCHALFCKAVPYLVAFIILIISCHKVNHSSSFCRGRDSNPKLRKLVG